MEDASEIEVATENDDISLPLPGLTLSLNVEPSL
jgi:hypothetical protein